VIVIDRGRLAASGTVSELTAGSPGLRFRSRPGMAVDELTARLAGGLTAREPSPGQYRIDGPVTPQIVATVTAWCAEQAAMPEELSTSGGSLAEAYFEITARSKQPGPSREEGAGR